MLYTSVRKVLIVDDSVTVCRFLESVFQEDPELEVVGLAFSAFEARDKIKALSPDVITLDIEMPGMDGLTFLKNLMRLNPLPVVMFSSLTEARASATLEALEIGAVDFMPKRSNKDGIQLEDYVRELRSRVKIAAGARVAVSTPHAKSCLIDSPEYAECRQKFLNGSSLGNDGGRLIALGASTGGPEALKNIIVDLDAHNNVLVISQHMPSTFVGSFAKRLNNSSAFTIDIAKEGEPLVPGHGYIAPGDQHLSISKGINGPCWALDSSPKVSGHRPSVNVLLESLAKHVGRSTVAALLTGMGDDGAAGLLSLRASGAVTIAQDEETSMVFGMPGRAIDMDAADSVLALNQIAPTLNKLLLE